MKINDSIQNTSCSGMSDSYVLGRLFVVDWKIVEAFNGSHSLNDSAEYYVLVVHKCQRRCCSYVKLRLSSVFELTALAHSYQALFSVLNVE